MTMRIRGFLYDLARNQRVHPAFLERLIDRLAEFGFNMLLINLEYRFDFPSCPGIAPPGSLTPAMARRLVEYGKSRRVEVVGQINIAGHCEGIASTERYAHLSCDPYAQYPWGGYEQLNLENAEVRRLVSSMIRDVCEAFPGIRLHIGCDEIRRMDNLFPGNEARQREALSRQLDFLLRAARETGRQIMIWGDMPLKHPELIDTLPKDVVICDWCYEPEGSRTTLEKYKAAGFSVVSCPAVGRPFAPDWEGCYANIEKMVVDAISLELEGVLLTSWEYGHGLGYNLIWPWVALAGVLVGGANPSGRAEFLSAFAETRYGVRGADFLRLCELLNSEFMNAVKLPPRFLRLIRESLFRSGNAFGGMFRPNDFPENNAQQIWEPSPFLTWLLVRTVLTDDALRDLEALAREADALRASIKAQAKNNRDELQPWLALGAMPRIIAERLRALQDAKESYHAASLVQRGSEKEFRAKLDETASHLERIQDGLRMLEDIVLETDRIHGLDSSEIGWIRWDMHSLDSHIQALQDLPASGDSILEFGEFLKRPVGITQRLPWR